MSAVDEIHAAVFFVHVDERNPASGAFVAQIAPPVTLVLMPICRSAFAGWFAQELIIPEFKLQAGERRAKLDEPFAIRRFVCLRPNQRRRGLHDPERTLVAFLFGIPRPV